MNKPLVVRDHEPRPVDLDTFELHRSISHLLRRAHFRSEAAISAHLAPHGLTPRQKALLIMAHQHPGAQVSELAELIALDRTSTAEMLGRLVERGLCERRRASDDARAWAIWITEAGRDLLREVLPGDPMVEDAIMEPLNAEDRATFVRILRRLTQVDVSKD